MTESPSECVGEAQSHGGETALHSNRREVKELRFPDLAVGRLSFHSMFSIF